MNENRLLNSEFIYQSLVKNNKVHYFINRHGRNMTRKAPMDKIGASYAFDLGKFASGYYSYSHYPYKETPLCEKIFYYIREFIGWASYILHIGFVGLCVTWVVLSPIIGLIIVLIKCLGGK